MAEAKPALLKELFTCVGACHDLSGLLQSCFFLMLTVNYSDCNPDVAKEHERYRRYMAINPTVEAIHPLQDDLIYATSYACNIGTCLRPFRTALHIDPNNRKKSISVLVFAGKGYRGGHYMLPQYGVAFGSKPGSMVLHFSAKNRMGYHATSDVFYDRWVTLFLLFV